MNGNKDMEISINLREKTLAISQVCQPTNIFHYTVYIIH